MQLENDDYYIAV